MAFDFDPISARVIGVLLEKEVTTPEHYPLSLNSLTQACNQKSSREPVMSLSEAEVLDCLNSLEAKRLVAKAPLSGRVEKYQHRFCNSQFGGLQLGEQGQALICLLLLRGAQTPGELRTRSTRLANFADVSAVDSALNELMTHEQGALVERCEREPGKREARYQSLLMSAEYREQAASEDYSPRAVPASNELEQVKLELKQMAERLADVEQQLSELKAAGKQ